MLNKTIKQKYEQRNFKDIKTSYGFKQQSNSNALDLYIYDDVEASYYDWWGDEIISETSSQYIRDTLTSNPNVSQINVYINSCGGDVKEGLAIYNQLLRHQANITVYVDGFACSIASVIAMAGNQIIMGSNTLMMIHRAWTVAMGNAQELRKAADDLEVIDSASTSSYLNKIGDKLSQEQLNQMLDDETWLTAQQCLEYGLCTSISNSNENSEQVINQLNQKLKEKDDLILNIQTQLNELKQQSSLPSQEKPKTMAQRIFKNKGGH